MEVFICRALRAEIIRVLNRDNNTNYTTSDIELMQFSKGGIDIDTKDGKSYKVNGRSIWY